VIPYGNRIRVPEHVLDGLWVHVRRYSRDDEIGVRKPRRRLSLERRDDEHGAEAEGQHISVDFRDHFASPAA
jgi:hypothetical protein